MTTTPARSTAEIDLSALRHNLAWVRARLPDGGRVAAVLKADAYGHGLRALAAYLRTSADLFAVANLAEARIAREAAPGMRILVLGPALPGERAAIVHEGFEIVVSSVAEARAYVGAVAGKGRGESALLHLAVDSGMGRIGVWLDDALATAREIAGLPGVRLVGIGSHLPSADSDPAWTEEVQLVGWRVLIRALRDDPQLRDIPQHLLNSAGVMRYGHDPELAGAFVRAGLVLYGSSPIPGYQHELRPVLTWKTALTLVRDLPAGRGISYGRTFITPRPMRVGTLAVGYGDGYSRHLSGGAGAEVLVRGKRCPILGRVTMDQIMIDLSTAPDATEGDEVILIGQQGSEAITAAELAEKAGTIPWEIFTGITARVVRKYIEPLAP